MMIIMTNYTSTICAELSLLQRQKGIALVDILQDMHPLIFKMSMPSKARVELISQLAQSEYRLAFGTSDQLQLGAICGAFAAARNDIVSAAV